MATLFWVEDQSHWIDKFTPVLQETDFDGRENRLLLFRFAEAAKQRIGEMTVEQMPDIAILDARMKGNDQAGFLVSRALQRKWPELPIIYLSEHSGTGIEGQAFEQASTQDFIAKHQRNVEAVLCWRIKAILRQRAMAGQGPTDTLVSGELSLDLIRWEVYWRRTRLMNPANPKRPLPPMPRKILRQLVQASPRGIGTERMAELLNADPERFSYANYRQHIKTLRHAFDLAEGQQGSFIERCKSGRGIVTFGDLGAYGWVP
ncbi:response regulator [Aestuariirhabdus litorea]|uniref:DNA-binding response regulator n=1 Tax=Aestuariirhabdus litorea TaxID=2528527 RepID=A0A3P3VJX3_9GAMM|nr:response regulator [Aestuariirhabdus litorea]RRJ83012.1 DNA-binding response regulator [Aestuariirhabdus litorea]RWW93170.1 response regulator [Endozoicomonadaceae bacterium GTF-13]